MKRRVWRFRLCRERGVVLFIALIVLVAMTMASIALIRSTDTGSVIAGNVASSQSALQEADAGGDVAFQALSDALSAGYIANKAVSAGPRYYATMQALNSNGAPLQVDTMTPDDEVGNADVYDTGVGPNGNRVRYVIERMCNPVPGTSRAPATETEIKANCLTYAPTSISSSSRNALRIKLGVVSMPSVYYRVTVRVDGPKNTVRITQALVRI